MAVKRTTHHIIHFIPFLILFAAILLGVYNAPAIYRYLSRAAGENANITIDAQSNLGGLPRPWRNLAQGGEDKDWRMGELTGRVKALNPAYIRLDHIYDYYDIVSKDGSGLHFNWTSFDAVINDILATGAKPFISLSYMPPAIAVNGDVTGLPVDWGEYQTVIQKTIQHFSRDRGITDVYYEVWNEPDLFGGWKTYGPKNYLTLYAAAARGAASVSGAKTFKFGGPATTALYRAWFDRLSEFAAENNLRLDFISWHRYSTDIEQFREDVANAGLWLQSYPKLANTELLITEWGHNPENDSGYDSAYAAAHTAAVATELSGIVTKAFVFEIQDGKDPRGNQYWGRWGIFTSSSTGSKAKPRFKALQMLESLGNTQLQMLGKGTWVKGAATMDGDTIKVLLSNFDPVGRHSETVPVTLTNLTQQTYSMRSSYLDGSVATHQYTTEGGSIRAEVPMRPNTVVVLTFTPI